MASKKTLSTANLIIVAALASLLAIVVTLLIGRGLVGSLLLNNRVMAKKNSANKVAQQNLDAITKLSAEYDQLGNTKTVINNALPTTADVPALASMMEYIASASGIRLSAIAEADGNNAVTTVNSLGAQVTSGGNSAPVASGNEVQAYAFSVTVEGNYTALRNFVQNAQLSARPLRITSMTISGSNNTLQSTIGMTSYYQAAANLEAKTEVVK